MLENLNYFEKWLLGYYYSWSRHRAIAAFAVSEIVNDFNEDEIKVVRATRKLEKLGYLKAKYTTSADGVEEIHLTVTLETIY